MPETLFLPAAEPFDGESLLAFLAARAIPGVERVVAGTYSRTVTLTRGTGVIAVTPEPSGVRVEHDLEEPADAEDAVAACRRLFDLDADPDAVDAVLGRDDVLGPLARSRPGLRMPGAADGFELAVRAIVGQQVSVAGARTVLGRMVAEHGDAAAGRFPTAAALAGADPDSFPFPGARARALVEVARLVAAGELRLQPEADRGEACARLLAVPGIGPWTVSYIAMRALGDRDRFLPGDVAVRRALERLGARAESDRWRPWRSYAVMHLWRSLGP